MDVSEEMLEEARKKGVYLELHRKVLGESLGFSSHTFDAVIGVGVFSPGQGPASAFDELIRITRPSGSIIFTLVLNFMKTADSASNRNNWSSNKPDTRHWRRRPGNSRDCLKASRIL